MRIDTIEDARNALKVVYEAMKQEAEEYEWMSSGLEVIGMYDDGDKLQQLRKYWVIATAFQCVACESGIEKVHPFSAGGWSLVAFAKLSDTTARIDYDDEKPVRWDRFSLYDKIAPES